MSDKVGNVSFYDSSGQADFGFTKPYSEKTAEVIDHEVKKIIDESYQRAKDVLRNNMKGLVELAEQLLEKEVIFSEDLERIFGKRKGDKAKEETDTQAKNSAGGKKENGGNLKPARGKARTKKDVSSRKSDSTKPDNKE
jgi:hypothetical protein